MIDHRIYAHNLGSEFKPENGQNGIVVFCVNTLVIFCSAGASPKQ